MRGTKAKRLRSEARRIATEQNQLDPVIAPTVSRFVVTSWLPRHKKNEEPEERKHMAFGEGTVYYQKGYRRIYQDLKRGKH